MTGQTEENRFPIQKCEFLCERDASVWETSSGMWLCRECWSEIEREIKETDGEPGKALVQEEMEFDGEFGREGEGK